MSAAIVRKTLEASEDTPGPLEKASRNAGKKKLKAIEKKKQKKITPEKLVKRNLRILRALEFASKSKRKYGSAPSEIAGPSTNSTDTKSKKKKKKAETSAFTEEDFEKFEKEYFVTDN